MSVATSSFATEAIPVGALLVIIGLAIFARLNSKDSSKRKEITPFTDPQCFDDMDGTNGMDGFDARVLLLERESSALIMNLPSISTVTFFEGDVDLFESYIARRLHDIYLCNPWLGGKLEKQTSGRICLNFKRPVESRPLTEQSLLRRVRVDDLHEKMSAEEIFSRVAEYEVKRGVDALKNVDEPLFRVTLLAPHDSQDGEKRQGNDSSSDARKKTKFALFFSLSHVIADGHTYYKLYNMLSENSTIEHLVLRRVDQCDDFLLERTGGVDNMPWFRSPGVIINFVRNAIFGARPEITVLPVNLDKIKETKAVYSAILSSSNNENDDEERENHTDCEGSNSPSSSSASPCSFPCVHFVSTNDIITSTLMDVFQSDVGLMAVNLRGRVKNLTEMLAGNYESMLLFQKKDREDPSLIRRALALMRRCFIDDPLPTGWHCVTSNITLVSSWATFFRQIHLPPEVECSHLLHLPFCPPGRMRTSDTIVIFRPREHELAMVIMTRSFRGKTDEMKEKLHALI